MSRPIEVIEVQLPVCPTCLRVGKQPFSTKMNFRCVGGPSFEEKHKQVRMVPLTFFANASELPE